MKPDHAKRSYWHIFLFGFLVFILFIILFGPPGGSEDISRIVITNNDVEQVRNAWGRTWQREPTREELQTALKNYIREEVLYREAISRGYDQNDQTIKRSLVRKMDFIAEGQVQAKDFSDDEIKAYYALRKERYRVAPRISFAHIFVNTDKRKEESEKTVRNIIRKIEKEESDYINLSEYGDRFMLQNQYRDMTEQDIQTSFGSDFASSLMNQTLNKWSGPLKSGYGLHAVYIYERTEAVDPDFNDIRVRIVTDMLQEERRAAKEQFYTEILRNYKIVHQGKTENILRSDTE